MMLATLLALVCVASASLGATSVPFKCVCVCGGGGGGGCAMKFVRQKPIPNNDKMLSLDVGVHLHCSSHLSNNFVLNSKVNMQFLMMHVEVFDKLL